MELLMHPVQRRHTYTNAVIAVYILQFFSISKVTIRWYLGIEKQSLWPQTDIGWNCVVCKCLFFPLGTEFQNAMSGQKLLYTFLFREPTLPIHQQPPSGFEWKGTCEWWAKCNGTALSLLKGLKTLGAKSFSSYSRKSSIGFTGTTEYNVQDFKLLAKFWQSSRCRCLPDLSHLEAWVLLSLHCPWPQQVHPDVS